MSARQSSAMQGLARIVQFREAIASVSLSHAESCRCDTCKAAKGDECQGHGFHGRTGGIVPTSVAQHPTFTRARTLRRPAPPLPKARRRTPEGVRGLGACGW
jgi:hypothetical protein